MGNDGLSESDSGSGVAALGEGAMGAAWGARGGTSEPIGCVFGTGAGAGASSVGFSGAGVSSTVECLPVVHGGIVRNSSNVRTRGLQQFQPGHLS